MHVPAFTLDPSGELMVYLKEDPDSFLCEAGELSKSQRYNRFAYQSSRFLTNSLIPPYSRNNDNEAIVNGLAAIEHSVNSGLFIASWSLSRQITIDLLCEDMRASNLEDFISEFDLRREFATLSITNPSPLEGWRKATVLRKEASEVLFFNQNLIDFGLAIASATEIGELPSDTETMMRKGKHTKERLINASLGFVVGRFAAEIKAARDANKVELLIPDFF